jgi:glycosyltransferase involved in cell wall biosynthesis
LKVLVSIFEELVPLSGGGTPRIFNVVRAFVRKGHQVYVAAAISKNKEEAIKELGCADFLPLLKVSRLDAKKMTKYLYAHPQNILEVIRCSRRIRPKMIVSHNSIAGFSALLVKRFTGYPMTVLDLTDLLFQYLEDYDRNGGLMRLIQIGGGSLEKKTILDSDKIITISNSMRNILKGYGVNEEKVEVICDGVDTDIFKPVDAGDLRNKYGRNAEAIIVFQGVIDPQDKPDLILDASKIVLKKHPRTSFWIIGDGTAVPGLKEKVSHSGLMNKFYFSGWVSQSELARYISASDIGLVILPNTLSARGRVTLKEFEYWACGIPVVVPRLPALEEVVKEEETGLFYEPNSFQSLAKRIIELIENKNNRERLGEKGRAIVKERFEWGKLADEFVKRCENFERN